MPRKTRIVKGGCPAGAPRFNEAAARCRGKRSRWTTSCPGWSSCFNEAAARCRGKRGGSPRGPAGRQRFNEAAARCRGKQKTRVRRLLQEVAASMRPRPDAAENNKVPMSKEGWRI